MSSLQQPQPWDRVKKALRAELGDDVFSNWFGRVDFESIDENSVNLNVPVKFLQRWIKEQYQQSILDLFVREGYDVKYLYVHVRGVATPKGRAIQQNLKKEKEPEVQPKKQIHTNRIAGGLSTIKSPKPIEDQAGAKLKIKIKDIRTIVCRELGLTEEMVLAKHVTGIPKQALAIILYLSLEMTGRSLSETSFYTGKKDQVTSKKLVDDLRSKLPKNPRLDKTVKRIRAAIYNELLKQEHTT